MRRLFILLLVPMLLLLAVAPVAAVDPTQLGPDAPAGATDTESSGTGVSTDPGGGTTSEPGGTDGTTLQIVSDEVLRLHRAKGAPVGAPDPL